MSARIVALFCTLFFSQLPAKAAEAISIRVAMEKNYIFIDLTNLGDTLISVKQQDLIAAVKFDFTSGRKAFPAIVTGYPVPPDGRVAELLPMRSFGFAIDKHMIDDMYRLPSGCYEVRARWQLGSRPDRSDVKSSPKSYCTKGIEANPMRIWKNTGTKRKPRRVDLPIQNRTNRI